MHYISTRGQVPKTSFQKAILQGLADDGGLYIPETLPTLTSETLKEWSSCSYQELFFNLSSLYISKEEIPRDDLKKLILGCYGLFREKEIVKVVRVGELFVLELFHGPTFSFKDVALQFLGALFEYLLEKQQKNEPEKEHRLTVIGATSGDTGSAAIYGLRGRKRISAFVLYPKDRVSPIQEKQMITVLDNNIHNLSVAGTFDNCQSIVKELFGDLTFKEKYNLAAINSINWARIMAQMVYYFYSYFRVLEALGTSELVEINFSVPTGNFGDILAGFYASRMGLPIKKLICATNANNILHRFFSSGKYHKGEQVHITFSPSMDIEVASNFERFLFYLNGRDHEMLRRWMSEFQRTGKLTLDPELVSKANQWIISSDVTDEETLKTIKHYNDKHRYLICPHTAVGVCAFLKLFKEPKEPVITLATAHVAKFGAAVEKAIGVPLQLPEELDNLALLRTKVSDIEADASKVKEFVINALNKS